MITEMGIPLQGDHAISMFFIFVNIYQIILIITSEYTGTGTKFVAYLSPSSTLNDNISMEK